LSKSWDIIGNYTKYEASSKYLNFDNIKYICYFVVDKDLQCKNDLDCFGKNLNSETKICGHKNQNFSSVKLSKCFFDNSLFNIDRDNL
jgi:hypothetical protein